MKRISRDCLTFRRRLSIATRFIRNQLPAETKKSAVIQCAHQGWREPALGQLTLGQSRKYASALQQRIRIARFYDPAMLHDVNDIRIFNR